MYFYGKSLHASRFSPAVCLQQMVGFVNATDQKVYYIVVCYLWATAVNNRPDQGFFAQFFQWRGDAPSRVHVIRKSDGKLLASFDTAALFSSVQVGLGCTTFN